LKDAVLVSGTLLHEMRRRNSRYGLECLCGGGGLGIAAVFERVQIWIIKSNHCLCLVSNWICHR